MSDLLQFYLGGCYSADVLGKGKLSDALDSFKTIAGINEQLRREAGMEMQRLGGIHSDRCFISKKHLQYLQAILN